ncbi:unnamed protein product [Closterium sp. Yama58-4]|nr:unnamed protein product [Closterium sp. Yama58-4]
MKADDATPDPAALLLQRPELGDVAPGMGGLLGLPSFRVRGEDWEGDGNVIDLEGVLDGGEEEEEEEEEEEGEGDEGGIDMGDLLAGLGEGDDGEEGGEKEGGDGEEGGEKEGGDGEEGEGEEEEGRKWEREGGEWEREGGEWEREGGEWEREGGEWER